MTVGFTEFFIMLSIVLLISCVQPFEIYSDSRSCVVCPGGIRTDDGTGAVHQKGAFPSSRLVSPSIGALTVNKHAPDRALQFRMNVKKTGEGRDQGKEIIRGSVGKLSVIPENGAYPGIKRQRNGELVPHVLSSVESKDSALRERFEEIVRSERDRSDILIARIFPGLPCRVTPSRSIPRSNPRRRS